MYVKCGLPHKEIPKITSMSISGEFECAAVGIRVDNTRIIVSSIYRPPDGNVGVYTSKMEELLSMVFSYKDAIVIIAGDFNIEMYKDNKNKDDLFSLMNSFNLYAAVNEYTRITNTSRSCIDNIFSNLQCPFEAKVLHSLISDHTAQKLTFCVAKNKTRQQILKRIFSEKNKQGFINNLKAQIWDKIYTVDKSEVDRQWEIFTNIFSEAFNLSFPLRKMSAENQNKKIVPDDPEIKECKRELDVLYTVSRVDGNYKEQYKNLKKKYNHLLTQARAKNIQDRIKNSDNKSKSTWKIVNEINGKNDNRLDIQIEGDPHEIANNFNNYIINAAPQLVSALNVIPYTSNIKRVDNLMNLRQVDFQEIIGIVNNFKNKHSSGEDEVPTSILKVCINYIIEPIHYIINNSLKFGIFPQTLKVSVVKPIHKKGDVSKFENYRPITLVSPFSKLFEAVVCNQLMDYMIEFNLFNDMQHGYLKGKSTQTAIFQFTEKIVSALETENLTLGLFLDLSKAYDTLDHSIIFKKLQEYGIDGNALRWLRSYLSDRKQRVSIVKAGRDIKSDIKSVKLGIPQGSIIGPLLFIIYINDLSNATVAATESSLTMYADDANFHIYAANFPQLLNRANLVLELANEYFSRNKLILNKEKTNIVLFKTNHAGFETPKDVTINNGIYKTSNAVKFLGIRIDEKLNWHSHIDHLCAKLNTVCYSIRVLAKYVNKQTLKIVYHANFESSIRYGIIFYGSCSELDRVFIIQKRVLRIMLNLGYRESCRSKFKDNKILTTTAIYIQECLLFIFKNKNLFLQNESQHEHNTRTLNYTYPIHRLSLTEKSARYNCLKIFNKLPHYIQDTRVLGKFKSQIYQLLLRVEPYNFNEFMAYQA